MTEADSHPAAQAVPAHPPAWPMFRAVVGMGTVCGLAIVVVYELTRPVIQRNRIAMLERAITEVLPGATTSAVFRLNESGRFERVHSDSKGDDLVYAGYDNERQLVGLALRAEGMGYQDVLKLLYGYSFETETILGISVIESRETPGLGDRIESDPAFQENFVSLDVSLAPDRPKVAHLIEFVKPGKKTAPWQIDGISGATVTSKATAGMLRESSSYWVPLVQPRKADFEYREGGEDSP